LRRDFLLIAISKAFGELFSIILAEISGRAGMSDYWAKVEIFLMELDEKETLYECLSERQQRWLDKITADLREEGLLR